MRGLRLGLGIGAQRAGTGGGTAPVISNLAYDDIGNEISLDTDTASGTVYYELAPNSTPLTGAAIEASAMGSVAVASGVVTEVEDWTGEPDGTYWLNVVQKAGGLYSNVLNLEVTILSAFDPADLAGAQIVMDVSDITTLWQDTAGTTQVTTTGQTVGSVTNRGSLGGLFANSGGTVEPAYTVAAGRKHLDFDGSNDYLLLDRGAGSAFGLSGGFYLWLVMYDDGTSSSGFTNFFGMSASGTSGFNNQHGMAYLTNLDTPDTLAIYVGAGKANSQGIAGPSDTRTTSLPWSVVEFECIPQGSSPNYWLRVEQAADGGAPVLIGSGATTAGLETFPNQATATKLMFLGAASASGAAAGWAKCSIAAAVLVSGTLSSTDRDNVREWCRTRAGF